MTNSLLVQTSGTAPAGTPTAMRISAEADINMVAGLEHALDGGYTGNLDSRLDLLAEFFALPRSLREKIVLLRLGDVLLLNGSGNGATRLFNLWGPDMPVIGTDGAAIPVETKGGLPFLTFSAITEGMTSAASADFLAKMTGISGLFFGSIVRKTGTQGVGATSNPSTIMRAFTNSPDRPEMFGLRVDNGGDYRAFLRLRPETTNSFTTSPWSGDTKYGRWDWLFAQSSTETPFNLYVNTALKESIASGGSVTTYAGTGAAIDIGRNSQTDAASSQLLGSVHATIVGRAALTDVERAALDALMMARCAILNA